MKYIIVTGLLLLCAVIGAVDAQANPSDNSSISNFNGQEEEGVSYDDLPAKVDNDSEIEQHSLQFLLLGDWGKGGASGKYSSNVGEYTDDEEWTPSSIITENGNLTATASAQSALTPQKSSAVYQLAVAAAMASYANKTEPSPSFVLALGDNFYSNGVSSTSDPLWDYLWKDVYLRDYPQLRVPWFPVFGNHDYGGGASAVRAQLERYHTHEDDDLWVFPSTNYSRRFDIPGKQGGSVAIVFVDTTTLAPSQNKCCNEKGGVSTEVQQQRIDNQLAHIERMLQEASEDPPSWLLVAGHYPIHSAGTHGDMSELVSNLLPLLQKYKVHAYMCGHDHISEHLQRDGMEFFVAGAGSMTDQLGGSSAANLVWYGVGYSAFAIVEATTKELTISYVDADNTVRYEYTLTNPNALPPKPHVDEDPPERRDDSPGGGFFRSSEYTQRNIVLGFGVCMALSAFGLFVFFRRRNKSKQPKRSLVKSVDNDEVLSAIRPDRRSFFKHRRGVTTLGMELVELGLVKGKRSSSSQMTADTLLVTPITTLQDDDSSSDGFSDDDSTSSVRAEVGTLDGQYTAVPLHAELPHNANGSNPMKAHNRSLSSPI